MRFAKRLAALVTLLPPMAAIAAPKPAPFDQAKIEQLTGAKGKLDEKAGVFKVTMPRSDLKVTAGGVHITPPMGGVNVVAIHQHMTGEQPRIIFLHDWGIGKAADLAGAVVAALKETKHDSTP